MAEHNRPSTAARKRLRAWREKRRLEKAAPHEATSLGYLRTLQGQANAGIHVYAGTANPKKVAKRRAKAKVAKQSRKVNR